MIILAIQLNNFKHYFVFKKLYYLTLIRCCILWYITLYYMYIKRFNNRNIIVPIIKSNQLR